MFDWKKIILSPKDTMDHAIKVMDDEALKMVIVVDQNKKLLGTITDGDIRRGLIKHYSMDTQIEKIMHVNPTYCLQSESKESILSIMKAKNILQVPIVDEDLKVVGLETINSFLGDNYNSKQKIDNPVLIMAGGIGKRLLPITKETPKPLIKLNGKPIIENILIQLINSGFSKFFFSTHYQASKFKEYFRDGTDWGIKIDYINEEKPLGTAGALGLLPKNIETPLLVVNGDILTKVNYENLLNYHENNCSDCTICVRKQDFEIPYGIINAENNLVSEINEKPIKTFFINAGIYVINPSLLSEIDGEKHIDMPNFLTDQIQKGLKINMFPVHEYWVDIGEHENLKKAEVDSAKLFNDWK